MLFAGLQGCVSTNYLSCASENHDTHNTNSGSVLALAHFSDEGSERFLTMFTTGTKLLVVYPQLHSCSLLCIAIQFLLHGGVHFYFFQV